MKLFIFTPVDSSIFTLYYSSLSLSDAKIEKVNYINTMIEDISRGVLYAAKSS